MKQILSVFLISFFILTSCSGKLEAQYNYVSENKNVKITVDGKRASAVESWKVVLKVKAYDFEEGQLEFEIYADDLNAENISVQWEDETHAKIVFTQQDNTKRTFELIASQKQLQLAEI